MVPRWRLTSTMYASGPIPRCNGQQGQLGQGCGSPTAIARCASRIAHRANDSLESEQRNKERSSVLRYFVVAYLLLILCLAFFWLL